MGTCASVHRDPESAVRFRLVVGTKKVGAPPPAGGGGLGGGGLPGGGFDPKGRRGSAGAGFGSPGFGSKDEFFFDSQAWLDSDCEDFFSVNGDFTPSRGNTPNHQAGTAVKPQQIKDLSFDGFPDTKSEPSPRKKLAEFFREALSEPAVQDSNNVEGKVQVNGIVQETNIDQIPVSFNGTPCLSQTDSIYSGERVSNGDFTDGKGKEGKAMQCCLPSLVHSLNFNERKKQTPSSETHSGG